MSRLSSSFGRLFDLLALVAALMLFAMVMLVTADILLRDFIGGGFIWATEVSEYALYLITLLVAPWLLRRGQHIRVDLALGLLPTRVAWLIEAASDTMGFAVSLIMVRYGWLMTYESWRLGSITIKNLIFPEWWLLAPLPVAFALLAVEFVFRFHRLMGERAVRQEATSVS